MECSEQCRGMRIWCGDGWKLVSLENRRGGDTSEKGRSQRGLVPPVRDKSGCGWKGQINHGISKSRGTMEIFWSYQ